LIFSLYFLFSEKAQTGSGHKPAAVRNYN